MPNEINEEDGLILQNRSYGKPFLLLQASPNAIHRFIKINKNILLNFC